MESASAVVRGGSGAPPESSAAPRLGGAKSRNLHLTSAAPIAARFFPGNKNTLCYKYVHVTPLRALAPHGFKKEKASLALLARQTGAELQQMASTIMAATSRVVAAKTPFLGQGRAAANASPLRDVAAAASGRITMVRNVRRGGPSMARWFQSIR